MDRSRDNAIRTDNGGVRKADTRIYIFCRGCRGAVGNFSVTTGIWSPMKIFPSFPGTVTMRGRGKDLCLSFLTESRKDALKGARIAMPQMEGTAICFFAILLRQSAPFPTGGPIRGRRLPAGREFGLQGYLFLQPVHAGKDLWARA